MEETMKKIILFLGLFCMINSVYSMWDDSIKEALSVMNDKEVEEVLLPQLIKKTRNSHIMQGVYFGALSYGCLFWVNAIDLRKARFHTLRAAVPLCVFAISGLGSGRQVMHASNSRFNSMVRLRKLQQKHNIEFRQQVVNTMKESL